MPFYFSNCLVLMVRDMRSRIRFRFHIYWNVRLQFFALPPEGGALPRFDLIHLGLGPEGHTASLFPGSPALRETRRLVAAPYVKEVGAYRITLTPPVLNAAREVTFLVAGAEKAAIVREVLRGPRDVMRLPAQVVAPTDGELTWLLDAAAAAQL